MDLKQKITTSLLDKFSHHNGTINFSSSARAVHLFRQTLMGWVNGNVNVYDIKLISLMKLSQATKKPISWFLN